MALQILYEDNHLIAVYKPAGILVQEDRTGDVTLMHEVREYLRKKYHKTGNVFLGLIHRLDRPVEGIVLMAKTSKGASRLSEQFRRHTIEKEYHALVVHAPKESSGVIESYIVKDEITNTVEVEDHPIDGAQKAILSYDVKERRDGAALVRVRPMTGRSHQIRAQLSSIGCPIAWDVKYGAPAPLLDRSIALVATALTFTTATTNQTVRVAIPIPSHWKTLLSSSL